MAATGMNVAVQKVAARFIRKWEAVQVELNGYYSIERFTALNEYSRSTSVCRALLMIILTPFPSLVLVAAIDAMPLENPERGLAHSAMSWVRATLTCFIYTHCAIDQIRLYSPNLKLTPLAGLFISLPSAILTNALALVVAVFVCWPLPFATILMSGPWFGFMTFFLLRVRGAHMRANPEAVKDVIWFAKVCGAQIIVISVYAVFNTVFTNIPAKYQPVFALMIPAFKVVQKNILSRILAGRDDTKPQVIILNVEIFNALFISSCMQNSQSVGTSVTLIAVDLLQAAISILDLYRVVSEIKSLMDKLEITSNELIWTAELVLDNYPDTANRRPTAIVRNSNAWVTSKPQRFARASLSPNQLLPTMNMEPGEYKIPVPISRTLSLKEISSIRPSSNGRDAELTSTRTASINKLTSKEHYRLLKKALQVLFLTEFMLLIEFTEVLIPVIYGGYMAILYYLPNRRFYPQLADLTDDKLWSMIVSVLGYGMLELGSLVALVCVLNCLVQRHSLQQLTFVLDQEFFMVQPKLILWLTMTLQSSLPQLGNYRAKPIIFLFLSIYFSSPWSVVGVDYTFEFAWLRDNYNSTSTQ